ncbi:MAG: sulfurtransferase [Pseudomonadota bacterium]
MTSILNISAYKFVALSETARWRERIRSQAHALGLKGTVLLADEGINLFVAGTPADVRTFLAWLTAHEAFVDLPIKESWSDAVPFGKLLVKVKPEIIRMNHPTIRPQAQRAPAVDAKTLARWLDTGVDDAGREVVTLDTRNAFEVDHGRLEGALDWRIAKFSEFPRALQAHRAELEGKTVVSYCTGGIRCEKAALLMAQAGLENVLQLDGGILKYFEETGGKHFAGDCFVFDERGTLNDTLAPVRSV